MLIEHWTHTIAHTSKIEYNKIKSKQNLNRFRTQIVNTFNMRYAIIFSFVFSLLVHSLFNAQKWIRCFGFFPIRSVWNTIVELDVVHAVRLPVCDCNHVMCHVIWLCCLIFKSREPRLITHIIFLSFIGFGFFFLLLFCLIWCRSYRHVMTMNWLRFQVFVCK